MYTEDFSEVHELLAHIPADSATTEQNSGYVSLENHPRAVVVVSVGDLATNATFDIDIEQAQDTAGTGAKALAGKSTTQLTEAGTDSNKVVIIEIRTEELDVTNGFKCINVEVTPATAAAEFAVLIFGVGGPRYAPVGVTGIEEIIRA